MESEPSDQEAKLLAQPHMDQLAQQKEKLSSQNYLKRENGESELVSDEVDSTKSKSQDGSENKKQKELVEKAQKFDAAAAAAAGG